MSFKVENLEKKNMKKLIIEATAEEFETALEKAYQKNKGKINVQGFRKGKAPRAIIEKLYGAAVFYEEAANLIIPDAYEAAASECGLDIVSRPDIDVEQIEKGKPFIFTAEIAVKPEVKLGKYKGVEYSAEAVVVGENEIEDELNKVREQNARIVTIEDRPVEDGDIVTIDYEGFVDGVAFDGGKAEGHALTIGSHSFIDTFEEQLIGSNAGDDKEINVSFPEQYHAEELAGKPAVFQVKIQGIKKKELPELNDEFAQEASEFDSLDEYKADIRAKIQEKKEKEAANAKQEQVLEKIAAEAEMDIPDQMVDLEKRHMADEFGQRLQMQGLSMEQYMQFTGMTANKFMDTLTPQALKNIKYRLVLEEVVKAENITVSDDELEEEYKQMAEAYKMEAEKIKELLGEKEITSMKMDLAVRKASEFVTKEAVAV